MFQKFKVIYFASVCFYGPIYLFLLVRAFLYHSDLALKWMFIYEYYSIIGIICVMVDLWCAKIPMSTKAFWTFFNIFFSVLSFPVYWFCRVLKDWPKKPIGSMNPQDQIDENANP